MAGRCACLIWEAERHLKDQLLRLTGGDTNTAAAVVVVVAEVSFLGVMTVAVWLLRRHIGSSLSSTSRFLNKTMQQHNDKDEATAGEGSYDCVVCFCEVSAGEEYGKLGKCRHGVEFHKGCMESWLKQHSTCPICRSHVQRPLLQRLNAWAFKLEKDFYTFCDSALENVAASIGDCRQF